MGMLTDACPSCGCYPEAADMLDAHVRYIVRERDEARAALRAISDHPKCPAWAYLITLNILDDYEKENPT